MFSTTISRRRARVLITSVVAGTMSLLATMVLAGSTDAATRQAGTAAEEVPDMAVAVVNGTGEQIAYDVVDGMAVIENDILLGSHDHVQEHGLEPLEIGPPPSCPAGMQCGVIQTSTRRAWPDSVMPYTIAAGTPETAVENIRAAIDHWESRTSIRFVARTGQADYVEFVGTGSGNTCSSYLGRVGGRQPINYAGSGRGCLVHEIGHAVGLSHEQNRNDRDDYINIDFTNISGNAASQFRKATGSTDVGTYDFNSVMHYSAYSFALDPRRPVITAKDGRDPRTIGGRGVLTDSDVEAIEFVYGGANPPPPPPPPTTVQPTTTTTRPTTTEAPTTTQAPTTQAPTTEAPTTTQAPTTEAPTPTTAPPTTIEVTTTAAPTTTTTAPPTTKETTTTVENPRPTAAPPTTVEVTTTIAPTTPPTTVESTTTIAPTTAPTTAPPTTAPATTAPPTTVQPGVDQKPVLRFTTVSDGDVVPRRIPYGGINIVANDPDAGPNDGDGIRWVTLVLTDTETGRFLGARREYWSTFDWGLRLRPGRSYTLTAYAVSERGAGGGWSHASVTITAQ